MCDQLDLSTISSLSHITTPSSPKSTPLVYPPANVRTPPIPYAAVTSKEEKGVSAGSRCIVSCFGTFALSPLSSVGRSCSSVGPAIIEHSGFERFFFLVPARFSFITSRRPLSVFSSHPNRFFFWAWCRFPFPEHSQIIQVIGTR